MLYFVPRSRAGATALRYFSALSMDESFKKSQLLSPFSSRFSHLSSRSTFALHFSKLWHLCTRSHPNHVHPSLSSPFFLSLPIFQPPSPYSPTFTSLIHPPQYPHLLLGYETPYTQQTKKEKKKKKSCILDMDTTTSHLDGRV